ncbi:hypothetical protein CC1G_04959 [Coprinopsis cinerea okayama7|uniref:GST N-terminal domain-containing protein n=1 Tax=Coprinopsis cinerea (strain Okayama-7 / 130 / ATCC MYA-4618 / FGSC 9003) TaxID=240176 RepID=A8NSA6_COPC7|nr:hypothetical protein CC1G_04959 [Coprinopsis cinerea okayama7\|eukprot:XP_001835966.1 hypothetical protein CC1G_04959 [Coprinopsis cinerea okayama7\
MQQDILSVLDQEKITLFDLDSEAPGKAFSPSTWKVRYSLNFNKIPFVTRWLDFVEVQPLCLAIGAKPTRKRPDGSDMYTLPVIYDPTTKKAVSESLAIVEYLDRQYPQSPRVIPDITQGLVRAFVHAFSKEIMILYQFGVLLQLEIVKPGSKEYYRRDREALLEASLEDVVPKGEKRKVEWAKVKQAFDTFSSWFGDEGEFVPGGRRKWVMGDSPSFPDFVFAAHLQWIRKVLGEESGEWKDIMRWNQGRWAHLLEQCRIYEGSC